MVKYILDNVPITHNILGSLLDNDNSCFFIEKILPLLDIHQLTFLYSKFPSFRPFIKSIHIDDLRLWNNPYFIIELFKNSDLTWLTNQGLDFYSIYTPIQPEERDDPYRNAVLSLYKLRPDCDMTIFELCITRCLDYDDFYPHRSPISIMNSIIDYLYTD